LFQNPVLDGPEYQNPVVFKYFCSWFYVFKSLEMDFWHFACFLKFVQHQNLVQQWRSGSELKVIQFHM